MKHVMKTTKKKLASLLALMLAVKHLSGPALAAETPEETPVVVPDQSTAGQTVIIPESDYIYVNGSNKVFTADGELSVLMRLTVTNPGRVHILTSGVDVSVVLFNEVSSEVCGVYSSVDGVMDAPLDAAPGTYLLGFSGQGEVAVLAADEENASAIFAEAGVSAAPVAAASAGASGEAAADQAPDYSAWEIPIVYKASLNETVSVASVLREAGASVNLVKWILGEMDGRLVRAEVNGDWLLTPYTFFDELELTVRAADSAGADTVYTLLFSCPDPSVAAAAEEADNAGSADDAAEPEEPLTDEVPVEGAQASETEENTIS